MSGFTGNFITSTNDNGKALAAVTEAAAAGDVSYVAAADATPDTTSPGFSLSYNLDALTITAFNKDVKTKGTKSKGYSGVGVSYDLGGMIAKADASARL